jgi:hypothetical protein
LKDLFECPFEKSRLDPFFDDEISNAKYREKNIDPIYSITEVSTLIGNK